MSEKADQTTSGGNDELSRKLENLPTGPGVYQFRNADGTIIYVGKARNLRSRVRSYFQEKGRPDPKTEILVSKISDVDLVVTDSEVEALLLENNLIKEHAPRYNIRLKDDKSYPYIVVTNEPFARVFPTRVIRRDGSRYYGPYTDVKAMRLMLRTIRSIFPIRSCDYVLNNDVIEAKKVSLCLDYHINKCGGPCEGLVGREEYASMIQQVEQLLKGKTRTLRDILEEQMQQYAEDLAFEKAADMRNRLQALQVYRDKQKVATSDFADRDIIGIARKKQDAVCVLFRVRDGKIVGKQHFPLTGAEFETESAIIEHIAYRYYSKTMDIPPELLLPTEPEDDDALQRWLQERAGITIAFTVPKIGDKLKLLRMCQANASFVLDDILLQKLKAESGVPKSVEFLQRDLHLPKAPRRIECFDISHFQGAETVASMVSFLDGKARKSEYRKYSIKTVEGVDDFASMREVVSRRYTRLLDEDGPLPDLIVIDGGKGQLSSAVEVLSSLGLQDLPVIGLAKRLEEVFLPGERFPQNIAKTSPGLKLLQRIRDEAHRFAVTFHRERRTRATLQSELEQIEGVGPKRAQALLSTLGSVRAISTASSEHLAEVVGWSAARSVFRHFNEESEIIDSSQDEPSDQNPASALTGDRHDGTIATEQSDTPAEGSDAS